jgi:transposase
MLRDLDFSKYTHVWIFPNYTDMRQGIDKLAAIIQYQLHLDAYDEHALFLFCGKRRSRLKALAFEGLSEDFCYPHI